MIFSEAPLAGAWVIEIEPLGDERGFFARTVDDEAFREHGLDTHFVQQSISWNPRQGTLRGLHYQAGPYEEDKLVRVTRGAIHDVIVDLRDGSATRGRWFGVELSADNHRQLFIPRGFAHGFQTLEPNSEVHYQMTVAFRSSSAGGIRWDDPALAISWPDAAHAIVGERDQSLPTLEEVAVR